MALKPPPKEGIQSIVGAVSSKKLAATNVLVVSSTSRETETPMPVPRRFASEKEKLIGSKAAVVDWRPRWCGAGTTADEDADEAEPWDEDEGGAGAT